MSLVESVTAQCPYCWESIEIVVDTSPGDQEYIEDCPVCCHPITFNIRTEPDGRPVVQALGQEE